LYSGWIPKWDRGEPEEEPHAHTVFLLKLPTVLFLVWLGIVFIGHFYI